MIVGFIISAITKLGLTLISFLGASAMQIAFDAMDEGVETLLEKAESKAKASQNTAADRRLMVLRKYFDGWKSFEKKNE